MLRDLAKLYDFSLHGNDGEVGKVDDFYLCDEDFALPYLVVDIGSWLFGKRVLVATDALLPLRMPLWERKVLVANLTREQIKEAPELDLDQPITREAEADLRAYYGWPLYWAGSVPLGMPIATADATAYPIPEAAAELDPAPHAHNEGQHLRSTRQLHGYGIEAEDGGIGHVETLLASEDDWVLRYLVVDTRDWLPGRKVLLATKSLAEIDWSGRDIHVRLTRDQVRNAPEYHPSKPIERAHEMELLRYYGYEPYWMDNPETGAF